MQRAVDTHVTIGGFTHHQSITHLTCCDGKKFLKPLEVTWNVFIVPIIYLRFCYLGRWHDLQVNLE